MKHIIRLINNLIVIIFAFIIFIIGGLTAPQEKQKVIKKDFKEWGSSDSILYDSTLHGFPNSTGLPLSIDSITSQQKIYNIQAKKQMSKIDSLLNVKKKQIK